MELKSIIKAHDSNSWQYYFINGIQPHDQSPWFKPMTNYSSEAQFSLVTSKAQFLLVTSKSPVLTGNIKKAQFSLATLKSSVLTSNIKTQFSLATSKAQFLLAISKVQFALALFYQKPKIINAWQKYYVIIISFKRWTIFLKLYYGILLKKPGQSFYKS